MKAHSYKTYIYDGEIFFKYKKPNTFLYKVEIFKYVNDESGYFRMELHDSGEFETQEFIGVNKTRRKKTNTEGIVYEKSISLLAAPDEFIKKYNIKQLTDES